MKSPCLSGLTLTGLLALSTFSSYGGVLNVNSYPSNGGSCAPNSERFESSKTPITINAVPSPGYVFYHWAGSNVEIANPRSMTTQVVPLSDSSLVTAVFAQELDIQKVKIDLYTTKTGKDKIKIGFGELPEAIIESFSGEITVGIDDAEFTFSTDLAPSSQTFTKTLGTTIKTTSRSTTSRGNGNGPGDGTGNGGSGPGDGTGNGAGNGDCDGSGNGGGNGGGGNGGGGNGGGGNGGGGNGGGNGPGDGTGNGGSGPGDGTGNGAGNGDCDNSGSSTNSDTTLVEEKIDNFPYETPSMEEAKSLQFMLEEEKLTRDVYVTLSGITSKPIMKNIALSEQRHMDELALIFAKYDMTSSASTTMGVFNDESLQAMYDDLIAKGQRSLEEALKVGALVEEKEIADLLADMETVDNLDILYIYENLLSGSKNHLNAFYYQLSKLGIAYEPQVLSQEVFAAIVNASEPELPSTALIDPITTSVFGGTKKYSTKTGNAKATLLLNSRNMTWKFQASRVDLTDKIDPGDGVVIYLNVGDTLYGAVLDLEAQIKGAKTTIK